jgi:hypothetical protein
MYACLSTPPLPPLSPSNISWLSSNNEQAFHTNLSCTSKGMPKSLNLTLSGLLYNVLPTVQNVGSGLLNNVLMTVQNVKSGLLNNVLMTVPNGGIITEMLQSDLAHLCESGTQKKRSESQRTN